MGIIHKAENVGPVELATMSFGQSFQITPLQLLRAASAIVNGGYLITPHFARGLADENDRLTEEFTYETGAQVISKETSETMKTILESVQGIYPRISYRRQDGNLGKAAAQKRKIYCILSILCAGGKSAGDGTGAD